MQAKLQTPSPTFLLLQLGEQWRGAPADPLEILPMDCVVQCGTHAGVGAGSKQAFADRQALKHQSNTQDVFPTTEAHSWLLGKENLVDAWNKHP
jgi:hypothetical protein